MERVILKKLHCIVNDEIDKDEIYLKCDGKKIWPKGIYKRIDTNETFGLDNTVVETESEKIEIEIWDFDYLTANDLLGTFVMIPGKEKGNFTTSMKTKNSSSTASYILAWSVE